MKYLVAILLLAVNFMPAEFHPIDEIISLELADLTGESSKTLIENRTKTYDGDLVSVSVENNGGFDEYIGFQVYLPEQVDLFEFNSKSSGPKINSLNRKKSTSTPLQLASLTDDDIQVHEMQTASTRTGLRSGNKIDFVFNYEAENIESKQTNQFLAVLDVYSDNPDQLKVKLNSANFGHGNYPDASKHRWLIRTHAGYSLSLEVKEVDMEKDLDTVTVYDVHSSGTKKLVSEVNVAKQLDTSTNQMLVVFKSDCSVNRGGFSAIVNVVRDETPITTEAPLTTTQAPTCGIPADLENGYFIISDGDDIAKDNINVTYYCNENYTMANRSFVTLHCFGGAFEPSFVDAALYCEPAIPQTTAIPQTQTISSFLSYNVRYLSYNIPNHLMGLKNGDQMYLTNENVRSFRVVEGHCNVAGAISLESHSPRGYFLRHQNSYIYLHVFENSESYKFDACFYQRDNKYFPGFVAYESVNYPSFYIRHQDSRLRIDKDDGTELFKQDASWKPIR